MQSKRRNRSTSINRSKIGLGVTLNATDAANDIDIAAGRCCDDSFTTWMILSSGLTKKTDATFVAGNNQGCWDSGAKPSSGILAIYEIRNPSSGAVDILASSSFTAPTMPSGFTQKRLIDAIVIDSSTNQDFIAVDNYRRLKTPLQEFSDNTISNATSKTKTLRVPPFSKVMLYFSSFADSGVREQGLFSAPTSVTGGFSSQKREGAQKPSGDTTVLGMCAIWEEVSDSNQSLKFAAYKGTGVVETMVANLVGFTIPGF